MGRSGRICYFGTYSMEEGYPRNRVIIEGLRKNGVDVIECHEVLWRDTDAKLKGIKDINATLRSLWGLLKAYARLVRKFRRVGPYDALIVGYAGHIDIFLAKILNAFRGRPVIFDAFLSLYDTAVADRRIIAAGSLRANLLRLVDTWACRVADAVLLDTGAHIDYFVREFHLPPEKFFAVPVGSSLMGYNEMPSFQHDNSVEDRFSVLYFGSYIPLHGVDIILKAAKILQDSTPNLILFTMIGKGQLLPEMKRLVSDMGLKNVNFIEGFMKETELIGHIRAADICLGIFGETDKALRVIPCKVYNCLAMGKPLITAETPAAKAVLTHGRNVFFCKPGDPEALAGAILSLKRDEMLRRKIAGNGKVYFHENFSAGAIGKRVMHVVKSVA